MTATFDAHPAHSGEGIVQRLERAGRRFGKLPLVFVVLASVIGTFLVFAQPPGQGLDEVLHFYRVWGLSQGTVIAPIHHQVPGGNVPNCVVDYLTRFSVRASTRGPFSFNQYWQTPRCSPGSAFTSVGSAASYGPFAYLPSILAVTFLRIVGAPIPVIFFGGRLASLVAFVALFYLAIRITPIGKQVVFVLGLLPTMLLLASSYSADPMTVSLAVLAVALTLRCCLRAEANRNTVLVLFLVLLALGLTKPTLFIFAPLILLVPNRVFGSVRHPRLIGVGATVVVLGVAGLWNLATRNVLGPPVPLYRLNSHAQTRFILDHPISYIEVLARTFFTGSGEGRWIPGFFYSIGYSSRPIADNAYASVGIVIVGSLTLWYAFQLQLGGKRTVSQGVGLMAWMPVALMLVGVLIVETTLFIYGTPVGLPVTLAQGRYFYPLLVLPLVTIGILREAPLRPRSTRWIVLGSVIMLVWLVLKIFVHDYTL